MSLQLSVNLHSPEMHQLKTNQISTWTYGAYLASEGERSKSAELWLTDAPFPRARRVASGCPCESGCHGGSGKSEIQNHHSRLAVHRCPPCCRTRRASSRRSPWKSVWDSGWPSRTALWSSALMTRLSHAVCCRCSHYLRTGNQTNAQITASCVDTGLCWSLKSVRQIFLETHIWWEQEE